MTEGKKGKISVYFLDNNSTTHFVSIPNSNVCVCICLCVIHTQHQGVLKHQQCV